MESINPERRLPIRLIADDGHYHLVIRQVISAKCSVWIATANVKDLMIKTAAKSYQTVLGELDRLAKAGVELRILHATLPSRSFRESFDRYPRLVAGGLELRLCPRVHFKVVIIDGETLYIGSANWTGAGLGVKAREKRNFELGMISRDALLLDQVQGYYHQIWSGRECGRCRRRNLCDAPLDR